MTTDTAVGATDGQPLLGNLNDCGLPAPSSWWQRHQLMVLLCIAFGLNNASINIINAVGPKFKKEYFGSTETAALVQSLIDCGSYTVGLFFAGTVGSLMDTAGRRPFLLINFGITSAALALAAAFPNFPIPYMALFSLTNVVQASAVMLPIIVDMYGRDRRALMFGVITAVNALTTVLVLVDVAFSIQSVLFIAFGVSSIALGAAVYFPETLAPEALVGFRKADLFRTNPIAPLRHVMRDPILLCATMIVGFFMLAQVGVGDVYTYYLMGRIHFTSTDNAYAFVEYGLLEPVVYIFVMPMMVRKFKPVPSMFIALCALVVELLIIALAWTLWPVYTLGLPALSLSKVLLPVVYTLIANCGSAEEQGLRMNSLEAISGIASAAGPLLFGLLYDLLSDGLGWLPFIICATFVIPAGYLALRLNRYVRAYNEAHPHLDEAEERAPALSKPEELDPSLDA